MNRQSVMNAYPWLRDETPKNVIMGDDLDAGLSTLLYLLYNPNATLVGIYTGYNKIFFDSHLTKRDLKDCIFIDLDIYQESCRSLGHHIIRLSGSDKIKGFGSSCNLNEIENRSVSNLYARKYPLGTIHFLIWLYDAIIPGSPYADNLIWLSDSSFINGQSHRFRHNVADWVYNLMNSTQLQTGFVKIDTASFEEEMEALQGLMLKNGLIKGSGRVTSKHKRLTGFQCQPGGNEDSRQMAEYIMRLLTFISSITGWSVPAGRIRIESLAQLGGVRNRGDIDVVLNGKSMDTFLESNHVFSYVFPFMNSINYTTGILND